MLSRALENYPYPTGLLQLCYRLLGLHLFFYAIILVPYGKILYSNQGVIPLWSSNGTPYLSSLFNIFDSPDVITYSLYFLAMCGLLIFLHVRSPLLLLCTYVVYASFQNRNILSIHPGTDVIGLLIISFLLVLLWQKIDTTVTSPGDKSVTGIPYVLYEGVWIILGTSFTVSGIHRFRGDSWIHGTGLIDFLNVVPIYHNIFSQEIASSILMLPLQIIFIATWSILLLFTFALPLALFKRTRPILLIGLIIIFGGVGILVEIGQTITALFILFLFLSDILLNPVWNFYSYIKNQLVRLQ